MTNTGKPVRRNPDEREKIRYVAEYYRQTPCKGVESLIEQQKQAYEKQRDQAKKSAV